MSIAYSNPEITVWHVAQIAAAVLVAASLFSTWLYQRKRDGE
jgi:hypothetical protein